jgi:transcriptional regulator with XRE-family HTH domain
MTLSERLVIARKRIGLTREELAKETGFTYLTIHAFEIGQKIPDLYEFRRIALALRVSADYLLDIDIK